MKKAFLKFMLFILFFYLLCLGVDIFLKHILRYSYSGETEVWNDVLSGTVNADIIIVGASRSLTGIDCQVIRKTTDMTCYNLSANWQTPYLQFARFYTYLKYNKKPKVVFLSVQHGSLQVASPNRPYYLFPYLHEDIINKALSRENPRLKYVKYIPLYGFAISDTSVVINIFKKMLGKDVPHWAPRVLGYRAIDNGWDVDKFNSFKEKYPNGLKDAIMQKGINDFEEFIQAVRDIESRLLIVYMPIQQQAHPYMLNQDEVFTVYENLSNKYGFPFLNYYGHPITLEQDNFYNAQHLNSRGAGKFSEIIGLRIKEILNNSDNGHI